MVFKHGVLLLIIIFSSVYAAFNIQSCGGQENIVKSSLNDAQFLSTRASGTLRDALNSPGGIPLQVQIILDAFLGPGNQSIYQWVLSKYSVAIF